MATTKTLNTRSRFRRGTSTVLNNYTGTTYSGEPIYNSDKFTFKIGTGEAYNAIPIYYSPKTVISLADYNNLSSTYKTNDITYVITDNNQLTDIYIGNCHFKQWIEDIVGDYSGTMYGDIDFDLKVRMYNGLTMINTSIDDVSDITINNSASIGKTLRVNAPVTNTPIYLHGHLDSDKGNAVLIRGTRTNTTNNLIEDGPGIAIDANTITISNALNDSGDLIATRSYSSIIFGWGGDLKIDSNENIKLTSGNLHYDGGDIHLYNTYGENFNIATMDYICYAGTTMYTNDGGDILNDFSNISPIGTDFINGKDIYDKLADTGGTTKIVHVNKGDMVDITTEYLLYAEAGIKFGTSFARMYISDDEIHLNAPITLNGYTVDGYGSRSEMKIWGLDIKSEKNIKIGVYSDSTFSSSKILGSIAIDNSGVTKITNDLKGDSANTLKNFSIYSGTIPTIQDSLEGARIEDLPTGDLARKSDVINMRTVQAQRMFAPKGFMIDRKKYTGIIATATDTANSSFFFGYVIPDDYYKSCAVKYKMTVTSTGHVNVSGEYTCEMHFNQNVLCAYKCFNSCYNTSYRPIQYHDTYRINKTGYDNGYGHLIGVALRGSHNPTNVNYARDFTIEIIETTNCTVTLADEMFLYTNAPGTGSANYTGLSEVDGTYNGLVETGDSNNVDILRMDMTILTAGANGIMQYSLIMEDSNGTYQSLTLTSGVGTTKSINTTGFKLNSNIYYYGHGANKAAGANTEGYSLAIARSQFDFRYSSNCGTTLTKYAPIYLVGTVGNDGLFYLAVNWYTQTLPTTDDGLVYIYIGKATSNGYAISLEPNHPMYVYRDGMIKLYTPDLAMERLSVNKGFVLRDIGGFPIISTINEYDNSSNECDIYIGDYGNAGYTNIINDMRGYDEDGVITWRISNGGIARFRTADFETANFENANFENIDFNNDMTWKNRIIRKQLTTTGNTLTYTRLCFMANTNATGNCEATFIISAAGNYGGVNQGAWLVKVSNRGSNPYIQVIELSSPTSTAPIFGYYTSGSSFYFGMSRPAYSGAFTINVLSNSATTFSFIDATTEPTGWTTVGIRKLQQKKEWVVAPNGATGDIAANADYICGTNPGVTLQKALDNMSPGDRLILLPGDYDLTPYSEPITTSCGGISIEGCGEDTRILMEDCVIFLIKHGSVTLKNMYIETNSTTEPCVEIRTYNTLLDNIYFCIEGNDANTIAIKSTSDMYVRNCHFWAVTTSVNNTSLIDLSSATSFYGAITGCTMIIAGEKLSITFANANSRTRTNIDNVPVSITILGQ